MNCIHTRVSLLYVYQLSLDLFEPAMIVADAEAAQVSRHGVTSTSHYLISPRKLWQIVLVSESLLNYMGYWRCTVQISSRQKAIPGEFTARLHPRVSLR